KTYLSACRQLTVFHPSVFITKSELGLFIATIIIICSLAGSGLASSYQIIWDLPKYSAAIKLALQPFHQRLNLLLANAGVLLSVA
ncbi:hypothetical protein, partial [Nostoc sp.]|uniref:hypothetical protein n=1 Tax=Nostoc sp. TaxID=1180 RepID=UPI002FF57D65